MPNGTKEAVEEGLTLLGEALKVLKPTAPGAEAIYKEFREIRSLMRTKQFAAAERRLGPALEFVSEMRPAAESLRPTAAAVAEELAARVPTAIPIAAPVAGRPAPALIIDRPWFEGQDEFGRYVISEIRIFGIPIHRIIRAGERVYFARLRAVVPKEIPSLIPGKSPINLSLAEKKGIGWDQALTEQGAITAAEQMTARAVRSGKPPALVFSGAGKIGKIVPSVGGKFAVEVRSAPGAPPAPLTRAVVDTYDRAINFVRRVIFGR